MMERQPATERPPNVRLADCVRREREATRGSLSRLGTAPTRREGSTCGLRVILL